MLLRFGVQNHLSIRDYQELSLVASTAYDDLDHTIDIPEVKQKEKRFLPVIALYGANAAGKSNILDAMRFFDFAVATSYSKWADRPSLPHQCFSLDSNSKECESKYDCDVLIDDVRYHYGFALKSKSITKEWLYFYPKGTRTVLFQRDFSDPEDPLYVGPSLKGITSTWKAIASNSKVLMLSAARKKENFHEQLSPVCKFFFERFESVRISEISQPEHQLAENIREQKLEANLGEALKVADLGIVGVEVHSQPVSEDQKKFILGLTDLLKKSAEFVGAATPPGNELEVKLSEERLSLKFVHIGSDGQTYKVDYSDESLGTRYFLNLLVPVFSALEEGKTLIVDEITTNLHTKLSEKIISLFTSRLINKRNAQFIFSTHDTNLLSREILRRDEIWFAEKDRDGATTIYPLSDFKIRKTDNVEKGYLQGRFGAIPFMGDISALLN